MQLEKAKETKQDMERCRLLAQRIAEELAPATAAVLNAETPALEKALHRAGVDANPFTVAARQADLLVVEDPAWVEMPAQLPGQVLLVFTGSNVAEGWAEELARRGYYRDFRWRSRGRAQQSALYCTVQPATAECKNHFSLVTFFHAICLLSKRFFSDESEKVWKSAETNTKIHLKDMVLVDDLLSLLFPIEFV